MSDDRDDTNPEDALDEDERFDDLEEPDRNNVEVTNESDDDESDDDESDDDESDDDESDDDDDDEPDDDDAPDDDDEPDEELAGALFEADDLEASDGDDSVPSESEDEVESERSAFGLTGETPNLLDLARPSGPPTEWPEPPPVEEPRAPRWFDGIRVTASLLILSLLMGVSFLMFVGIEPTPRWLLIFAAVMAILGTDGMLRDAWPRPFVSARERADTTPYLFLPALLAVSIPLLIEHNLRGFLVVPATIFGAVAFTIVLAAQVTSVNTSAPAYAPSRIVSTGAAYFSAFTLLSLSYVLDFDLVPAMLTAAIVGTMLGVEIFREGQVDPLETLIFAGVTGLVLAEARWAMYFIPVGGYLAGLTLLLAFFLVSGLLHSHLTRHLNRLVAIEYVVIATAGVILVTLASQAGLA